MPKKELPQLIKQSSTYKLKVPAKVEEKIRYLLRKFPSTEWSGVLFTTHEGTFEGNDLVITCQDIYPMDLGNATFTQFQMNEDVAAYMANNIELFDCDLQLIHSHHTMSTFFSGTDVNTLREEGNERNCFVSLIVNNAGVYNAAITRKVQTKHEVTIKQLGKSYEFFGEGEKQVSSEESQTVKVVDKETIEYFMLDVEREVVNNPLDYLDARFEEIAKKKNTVSVSPFNKSTSISHTPQTSITTLPKEQSLFDEKTMKEMEVDKSLTWLPNQDLIHLAVVRIITASLITSPTIDIKQWSFRHMNRIYKDLFPDDISFDSYAEFIIDFFLNYCWLHDADIPAEILEDEEGVKRELSSAMLDEFESLEITNEYIESYKDILNRYIYE